MRRNASNKPSLVIEGHNSQEMKLMLAISYGSSGAYSFDKDGVPLFSRYKSPYSLHLTGGSVDALSFSYRFVIQCGNRLYSAIFCGSPGSDPCNMNNYLKGDLLVGNWEVLYPEGEVLKALQYYEAQLKELSTQLFEFLSLKLNP
ncbi:MAG: hypothetical protein ABJH04_08105 [Cyclobacteriaceae bacterium]